MNPIDPKDSFTDWLEENWSPDTSKPHAFAEGIERRRVHHRKRRVNQVSMSAFILLIGIGGGLSLFPQAQPPLPDEIPSQPSVAMFENTTPEFWDTAFVDNDDVQEIPDDYEALAGFFLGDT